VLANVVADRTVKVAESVELPSSESETRPLYRIVAMASREGGAQLGVAGGAAPAAMVRVSVFVLVPAPLVELNVTVALPAVVGAPESTPLVALKVSPAGNPVADTDDGDPLNEQHELNEYIRKPPYVLLADAGFNPNKGKKPPTTMVDEGEVPEKFRRDDRLLLDLRNHVLTQLGEHTEETLLKSSRTIPASASPATASTWQTPARTPLTVISPSASCRTSRRRCPRSRPRSSGCTTAPTGSASRPRSRSPRSGSAIRN
jgi:hypothetical protein